MTGLLASTAASVLCTFSSSKQSLCCPSLQVQVLLAERRAAAEQAAAKARQRAAEAEAGRQHLLAGRKRDKPSLRSTAWETKVAQRAEVG